MKSAGPGEDIYSLIDYHKKDSKNDDFQVKNLKIEAKKTSGF